MGIVIDSDQHLYEARNLWRDYADPGCRDDALALVDDDRGFTWLTWRDRRLDLADVHRPGDTASCGRHREQYRLGRRSEYDYDEVLPRAYWDPDTRVGWLDGAGIDEAVCFPNFGLLWERHLSGSLPALLTNMAAWNRWCAAVAGSSAGRIHPVAHLTLRDPHWLEAQLAALSRAGVRLAMIAPASVAGRPLSHPDHERLWSAFVAHGVSPVFHVADQPRVFDDCWYTEGDSLVPAVESVFLWVPPALALTDLILNGVFARHPDLRFGVIELSSIWVPQFLLMLDGGYDFTAKLNGRTPTRLDRRPSDYFTDHVRVSSFSYEGPARLTAKSGDLYMCCSDFPHSEGTATPLLDYEAVHCEPADRPGFFGGNIAHLLRR